MVIKVIRSFQDAFEDADKDGKVVEFLADHLVNQKTIEIEDLVQRWKDETGFE